VKICPKCEGRYFDDMQYCSECFGGNKIELVTEAEYKTKTGKGFETLEKINLERKAKDFDFEKKHPIKTRQLRFNPSPKIEEQNVPKCPTCGSTDIRHISATERGVNAFMFGIFGNKRKCQFECQNPKCKYRW